MKSPPHKLASIHRRLQYLILDFRLGRFEHDAEDKCNYKKMIPAQGDGRQASVGKQVFPHHYQLSPEQGYEP